VRRVLFVCTGNQDRSPTAEQLLKGKEGIEVKSAGTHASLLGSRPLTEELTKWASEIYAMEEQHRQEIERIDPAAKIKIVVLGIEDNYRGNSPDLVKALKEKLARYFEVL
jgi:predicted protein tyrosine phosphatase